MDVALAQDKFVNTMGQFPWYATFAQFTYYVSVYKHAYLPAGAQRPRRQKWALQQRTS